MTKRELFKYIQDDIEQKYNKKITQVDIELVINAYIDNIKHSLRAGHHYTINNFFTLKLKHVPRSVKTIPSKEYGTSIKKAILEKRRLVLKDKWVDKDN